MNAIALVGAIHDLLDRLEIAHAFGGALALAYYAEPRGTVDVDVNVFAAYSEAPGVIDAMGGLDLYPEMPSSGWLPVAGIRLAQRSDGTKVDLFFSVDDEAYTEIRDRANLFPFADRQQVPFLSAEDLVMFKMSFNRPKDWVDIRSIVGHGGSLDLNYIERQLIRLRGPMMYPRLAVLRRAVRDANRPHNA
jgi:hypothetical protein